MPESLRALFGSNLKAARIKAGLSQKDLGAAVGIAQAYVSQVEAGGRNIGLDLAEALAGAVGKSVRDLLKPSRSRPPYR